MNSKRNILKNTLNLLGVIFGILVIAYILLVGYPFPWEVPGMHSNSLSRLYGGVFLDIL
jgi:hypothetical protein